MKNVYLIKTFKYLKRPKYTVIKIVNVIKKLVYIISNIHQMGMKEVFSTYLFSLSRSSRILPTASVTRSRSL